LGHPVATTLGSDFVWGLMWLFIGTELLNLVLHLIAVARRPRRHLVPWTLTMPFYFLLGALAAYKAIYELITQPFYWDKTEHGYAAEADVPEVNSPPAAALHPVPSGS